VFGDNYPYNTAVDYRCSTGYKFNDGSTSKVVRCLATGEWNVSSVEDVVCLRMYTSVVYNPSAEAL
jgi:hypothetical protein